MTSKAEKDKVKQLQDKCQSVLNGLLRDEDNKYCVDCDSKGPRWASWNIGVFLCIRCAGIHRNLGVHISKVKSVNLDAWTPEQVVSLQQMGNSRARAVYEANLPDNFRRPQNDTSLESFIRAKYEHKKYIAREWVPPGLPKVNWEKEIDEEIEKQKRKKKTIIDKRPIATVEVPQLPKPKNPSPKVNRVVAVEAASAAAATTKKNDDDLLGLQQNGGTEDSFSGFLSAAPLDANQSQTTKVNPNDNSEEESFFNQTVPAEKERVKLTKDSILALYGNNYQQQQINRGAAVYQNAAAAAVQQNQFNSFASQQQQNFQQQQNGLITTSSTAAYGGSNGHQLPYSNQQQWTSQNQFTHNLSQFPNNVSSGTAAGTNQFPHNNQYSNIRNFANSNSQFVPGAAATAIGTGNQFQTGQFQQACFNNGQQIVPNPFFASQNNLQQQFIGLSLNGGSSNNVVAPSSATNSASTTALASNIWQ